MKLILAICLFFCVNAQESVWILVDHGHAQYLNPFENEWVPIDKKEQVPLKTYLMTYDDSQISVFNQEKRISLPANVYVFLNDIFKKERMEIVAALVQIDAEQLPANFDRKKAIRKFGITYGSEKISVKKSQPVELKQRLNAVDFFEKNELLGSAALTLRRLMLKYPKRSVDPVYVMRLLRLYVDLNLDGYAYETSSKFIQAMQSDQVPQEIIKLNSEIRLKLTGSN